MYVCSMSAYERVLSVYRALQAVWGIEDHSNLDPMVTDPAQHECVNVCVDADISFLSVVCQTKQTQINLTNTFASKCLQSNM